MGLQQPKQPPPYLLTASSAAETVRCTRDWDSRCTTTAVLLLLLGRGAAGGRVAAAAAGGGGGGWPWCCCSWLLGCTSASRFVQLVCRLALALPGAHRHSARSLCRAAAAAARLRDMFRPA